MIESYEPAADVRTVDLDDLAARVRQVGEEWERHEAELHRLHPEIEAEARRGPVATPWQISRQ